MTEALKLFQKHVGAANCFLLVHPHDLTTCSPQIPSLCFVPPLGETSVLSSLVVSARSSMF